MKSRKKIFLFITLLALIFAGWFSWMNISTDKAAFIERKVESAISHSVKAAVYEAPRIKITENEEKVYYAPRFDQYEEEVSLEENVISMLNNDASVPLLKVTMFDVGNLYGELNIHVKVKYYVIFGITKTTEIHSHLELPEYETKIPQYETES